MWHSLGFYNPPSSKSVPTTTKLATTATAASSIRSASIRSTAHLWDGLGIHKFYLGGPKQKTAGIIQIVVSFVTCGVGTIIPLIEGIIYLTKDDQQFQYEYVQGGKNWF